MEFVVKPFKHQEDIFNQIKDLSEYGLFWEQGCISIDSKINTPNGDIPVSELLKLNKPFPVYSFINNKKDTSHYTL